MLCLQGYHCFINYRFVTPLLCSRPRLSLPLFVTSLYYLFKVCIVSLPVCYVSAQFEISTVSASVCYIAMLSPRGFLCFIICLLRHQTISSRLALFWFLLITSLLCSRLRLSPLPFVTLPWFLLKASIGSFIICLLCHCCVLDFDCLFLCFVTSLCFLLMVSIVSLSVCYVTKLSLQGFRCFIICLLRLSLPLFVTSHFIQAMSE